MIKVTKKNPAIPRGHCVTGFTSNFDHQENSQLISYNEDQNLQTEDIREIIKLIKKLSRLTCNFNFTISVNYSGVILEGNCETFNNHSQQVGQEIIKQLAEHCNDFNRLYPQSSFFISANQTITIIDTAPDLWAWLKMLFGKLTTG